MFAIKHFIISLLGLLLISANVVSQPIVPCLLNSTDQREGVVAACMIFQNEGRYLKEWLEYHKSIGISHFFLYNHASTDNYWGVLLPYVLSGQVELFDVYEKTYGWGDHNELQRQVYNHAVRMSKRTFEWLAIIDSDEFICMPHDKDLGQFLESYKYAAGLVVNWVMYGSSDVEELAPSDLQIERFLYRAPDNWGENFLYKTIVRPKYVTKANVHVCECKPNMLVYANHLRFSHTPTFKFPPIDDIRINHYWWRDEKYFREVKMPRRADWYTKESPAEIDAKRKIYNSVYDPSMLPFVKATRKGMKKLK